MARMWLKTALAAAAIIGALIVGRSVASVLLSAWLSKTASARSGPLVAIDHVEHDFGAVPLRASLCARFTVRNAGTRRLIVLSQEPPCCGDDAAAAPIVVEPDASQVIEIRVDTERYGPIEQMIAYTTNDPTCPEFTLTVRGSVIAPSEDAATIQPAIVVDESAVAGGAQESSYSVDQSVLVVK